MEQIWMHETIFFREYAPPNADLSSHITIRVSSLSSILKWIPRLRSQHSLPNTKISVKSITPKFCNSSKDKPIKLKSND